MNILTYTIISFIIIYVIHVLMKDITQQEKFNEKINDEKKNTKNIIKNITKNDTNYKYPDGYDIENTNYILEHCKDTDESFLKKNEYTCYKDKPIKSIKEYHNDFFNFRDKTQFNSSQQFDVIDKLAILRLNNNDEKFKNMKIMDIYDELTKGVNLYTKKCKRNIKYDDINYEGNLADVGSTGLHNVRDEWVYDNENILNGGKIDNSLYADDPEFNGNLPIKKLFY